MLAANVALFLILGSELFLPREIHSDVTFPPQYSVNLPRFSFLILILLPPL